MTTVYNIPLDPNAQLFDVVLGGVDYNMRLTWNSIMSLWQLDISDTNGNPLVLGIPLVDGCDLLQQYAYLGLGGALLVDQIPTYASLGVAGKLYFVTVP